MHISTWTKNATSSSRQQWSAGKEPEGTDPTAPTSSCCTLAQESPGGTAPILEQCNRLFPNLYNSLRIRRLHLLNRIAVSPPQCDSPRKEFETIWDKTDVRSIAHRGPSLIFVETTAVQSNGRISPNDSGIWLDDHIDGLRQRVDTAHIRGQKIGIQLSHAGRKASVITPFLMNHGENSLPSRASCGWPNDVVGPSPVPYSPEHAEPRELSLQDIRQLKQDFALGSLRAILAGFDVIQIQAAEGHLLHNFLSPTSNLRNDCYGGSFGNRVRLLLEVVTAVRAVIPRYVPLFARISATDWLGDTGYRGESWKLADAIELAYLLADRGVDALDISTGGNQPLQKISCTPGYRAVLAEAMKITVGDRILVSTPVEDILQGNWVPDLDTVDKIS